MPRTVLITGGAGFIGSHLADDALAHGERVVVLDNLATGKRENVPAGAVFYQRDLLDPGLDELLADEKVDVINHHAAQANVRISLEDPAADARVNVLGTLELIAAARRAGIRRLLFASSGGTVYGVQQVYPCDESHPKQPTSPYGCAKLAAELYLGAFAASGDLDPVILRYANVYGPRQEPNGEQTRDYVHVADVVAANRAAYERWTPGAYNVGTGVETSVNALFAMVTRALGVEVPPNHVPALAAELRRNSLDAGALERALGVRPRIALEEGLARTLPWYRARTGKR